MTLLELSPQYEQSAALLRVRIRQLQAVRSRTADPQGRGMLDERIRVLTGMWREMRELSVLTGSYYDRHRRRNTKYII